MVLTPNCRAFMIENLIGGGNVENSDNGDGDGDQNSRRYILQTSSNKQYNSKFKTMTVRSSFLIENLPANPEELLRRLFEHTIEEALNDAQPNGIRPDRLGATISSALLDTDIWIGVREITPNTADALLNRFMIVAQSKQKSLWGEPFTVSVTAINREALPDQHEIRGTGNQGKRKNLTNVHHNVNKGGLILVDNPPEEGLCLLYALELTRIHNTKQYAGTAQFHKYLYKMKDQQRNDVHSLMTFTGIPHGAGPYDAAQVVPKIVDYWNRTYALIGERFKVFIFGAMGSYKPEYMYGPEDFTHPISLYYSQNHFDGIRWSVGAAIFGRDRYCFSCLCPFDRAIFHTSACKAKCTECGRVGSGAGAGPCAPEPNKEFKQFCAGCGKTFCNEACWRHHWHSNYCQHSKRCSDCGKVYNLYRLRGQPHDCEKCYCRRCFRLHAKTDTCYIHPIESRPQRPYRLVVYDFECTQDERVADVDQKRFIHRVNFVGVMVLCPACIQSGRWRGSLKGGKPCDVCGPNRTLTFSHRPYRLTQTDRKVVREDPLEAFVSWLLLEFTSTHETVCFAHNAGRYDTLFMFKQYFMRGIMPEIVRKGNKIYELRVNKKLGNCGNPGIKMRDSLNLLPVSLERLVGAFGLEVTDKEFFPHGFNSTRNYDVIRGTLPPKEDYYSGSFPPEKKRRFDQWWEAHQHNGFNLIEALPAYCCSDVRILAEALVAFRQEWWEISTQAPTNSEKKDGAEVAPIDDLLDMIGDGDDAEQEEEESELGNKQKDMRCAGMDVLAESCTISSASIRYFRMRYLKPDHLVLLSNRPVDSAQTQSTLALKYFDWYAETYGCAVRTAHSFGGEQKFGRYTVDGWIAERQQIIEVFGDVWHACPKHFPDPETVMPNGKTAGRIRSDDARRLAYLNQCAEQVDVVWECEIRDQLAHNMDMRDAFAKYHDKGPINVREAFMGGRVGAERMHFKCPEGWEISYLDCNSMYPHEMLTGAFPVSSPRVHVIRYPDYIVDWDSSAHIPFKGIFKVFVVPPEQIDIPILPAKFDQRLCFSLCRTCALLYPEGAQMREYQCRHTDQQRGWVATLPHIELAVALDAGYRVTRYYRALEFEQFDEGLFAPFVRDFMSIKIHSSGMPEGVEGCAEREEAYIRECGERFGIRVERGKMKPNKARRECSKLTLNNIWAKPAQIPGLSKTKVTDSPAELRRLLDDRRIEICAVDELTEDCMMITYRAAEEEMEEEHSYHNPVISLWCSSLGRLHLLKRLRAVKRDPNAILLYYDTDSAIVAHRIGQCPIPTGPHLGEWKNELPAFKIVEFVCGGSKNYALLCVHRETGEIKHILHVRGISLTADVCERLHWGTFKQSVLQYAALAEREEMGEEEEGDRREPIEILIDYPRALRPVVKHGVVYTMSIKKRYRPVIAKGVVTPGGIVRPFGYRGLINE